MAKMTGYMVLVALHGNFSEIY